MSQAWKKLYSKQTIKQAFYLQVLVCYGSAFLKNRPYAWPDKELWYHDNASSPILLNSEEIFGQKTNNRVGMSTVLTLLGSLWLSIFPQVKVILQGSHFELVEDISEQCDESTERAFE